MPGALSSENELKKGANGASGHIFLLLFVPLHAILDQITLCLGNLPCMQAFHLRSCEEVIHNKVVLAFVFCVFPVGFPQSPCQSHARVQVLLAGNQIDRLV